MVDWTAGYVADIGYTYGYYIELNPLRLKLAFLNEGLVCPEMATACELGFGQGVSANFHAAASATSWCGTDFNPAQAGFAQELAIVSGSGAKLYDEAFADFANRSDLPDFDYIGLHGIWSWISDDNRAVIVEFIRRKLKVGGVLYISYNTQPGWAAMVPMRDLLTQHAEVMGAEGSGIVNRIDSALNFAEKLLATNPIYLRANPQISERIERIKGLNRNYIAHEYFNRDWEPMAIAQMAEWLLPAKLEFACSATYLDHIDTVNLSTEQKAFLQEIPDLIFRESVRDFMVNQQFRKDYWVKGARRHSGLEKFEALRQQKFILATHRDDVSLKFNGALGEVTMSEAIYNPLLDALADHKSKTLGQLEVQLKDAGIGFAELIQAVMVLANASGVVAVQDDAVIAKAKKHTDKLNAYLIGKAKGSNDICYLVSPVTGGGITVGRFQQMFLIALGQGRRKPAEWAQVVWQILSMQGQKIIKEGKTLETAEANLAELTTQAEEFSKKQLPILKALQVA